MSGPIVRRRPFWRHLLRALPLVVLLALTTTLAAALQVREVRVTGTHRFPARDVERTLRSALGTPTVAARPGSLRDMVRLVPWVEDAQVRLSLDGVVSCTVTERVPVAIAVDNGRRTLVDATGTLLAPASAGASGLELAGFGAYPDERSEVLALIPVFESSWGGKVQRVIRLGARDLELVVEGTGALVVADPEHPEQLGPARRVLAAWTADHRPEPRRLDARIPGRVAVLPAPEPPVDGPAREST